MRDNLINVFMEKNNQINLSAIRDKNNILIKHINDSIELNKILKIKTWKTIWDIWTGWWFPLLPLAITNPKSNFIGIDARKKKVDAVNDMIDKLSIKNASCIWSRIENFKKNYNIVFDYITARAVGYVNKIIPWSYDLLKKWWLFVLYKQYSETEYQSLLNICRNYKLYIRKQHKYKLFKWDVQRVIYIIEKH